MHDRRRLAPLLALVLAAGLLLPAAPQALGNEEADPLAAHEGGTPMPAEATHAAPIRAMDASWAGWSRPCRMRSAMVSAAVFPMTPDGMPVRGGDGAMTVPFGDFRGCEIWCGGANAMPTANTLS